MPSTLQLALQFDLAVLITSWTLKNAMHVETYATPIRKIIKPLTMVTYGGNHVLQLL